MSSTHFASSKATIHVQESLWLARLRLVTLWLTVVSSTFNLFVADLDSSINRIIVGIPFAFSLLGFLVLLQGKIKAPSGLRKYVATVLAGILTAGLATGFAYPLLGNIPFYPEYFLTDGLLILWGLYCVLLFRDFVFVEWGEIKRVFNLLLSMSVLIVFQEIVRTRTFSTVPLIIPAAILSILTIRLAGMSMKNHFRSGILLGELGLVGLGFALGYQRIAFVSFIVMVSQFITLIMHHLKRRPLRFLAVLLIISSIFGSAFLLVETSFEHSQIYKRLLSASLTDEASVMGRILEAEDVLRTVNDYDLPPLLGLGHGAVYVPHLSQIRRNFTSEGLVHNVHIGFFLLLLRYGILGACLYLCFGITWIKGWRQFLMVARKLSRCRDIGADDYREVYVRLVAFYLLGAYFVKFHSQSILIDPWFFISLAISLDSITNNTWVRRISDKSRVKKDVGKIAN